MLGYESWARVDGTKTKAKPTISAADHSSRHCPRGTPRPRIAVRCRPSACRAQESARVVARVIAIVGADVGLARLVQHHHDHVAVLDSRQREIDRLLPGAVGCYHHDDLPHLRRKNARLRRGKQRWRIEDDDAI